MDRPADRPDTTTNNGKRLPKRGRPAIDLESFFRMARPGCEDRNRRTHLNHFYIGRVAGAMRDEHDPCKLAEEFRVVFSPKGEWRHKAVLYELGRIVDPELIRKAARWFIETRWPASRAVNAIRHWRLTGEPYDTPAAEVGGLASAIRRAIDAYDAEHDGLTTRMIDAALDVASEWNRKEGDR